MWIAILVLAIGQSSLAENKLATLILPETGTKKVVQVNSQEANHYFDLGYHLMTNLLGASFTPTTAYAERLSISVAANATTIYVSSVLDRDGVVLPLSANNKGYFTLEPGTSREESIVCTTASSTISTLSGCTRGLAASGSDETGSSARAYSHNASSKIIMTDIAQFFGNFVDITNTQTIGGVKHFTNNPTTSTSTPTSENQIITKKYVDDSAIAGGVVGTESIPGIWIGATQDELSNGTATSTYSGTDYNLVLQSKYASSTSSATTTIPITKIDGKIDSSFIDQSANYTLTGNNTFSGNNNFTGTSTLATTTINGLLTINGVASSSNLQYAVNSFYVYASTSTTFRSSSTLATSNTSAASTTSTTYVKLKEIRYNDSPGYLVVEHTMSGNNSAGNAATSSIFINDVMIGTERFLSGITSATYYEVVPVNPGDLIQIYGKNNVGGGYNQVSNFKLYYLKGVKKITNDITL